MCSNIYLRRLSQENKKNKLNQIKIRSKPLKIALNSMTFESHFTLNDNWTQCNIYVSYIDKQTKFLKHWNWESGICINTMEVEGVSCQDMVMAQNPMGHLESDQTHTLGNRDINLSGSWVWDDSLEAEAQWGKQDWGEMKTDLWTEGKSIKMNKSYELLPTENKQRLLVRWIQAQKNLEDQVTYRPDREGCSYLHTRGGFLL